jgi:hypothetical protein
MLTISPMPVAGGTGFPLNAIACSRFEFVVLEF